VYNGWLDMSSHFAMSDEEEEQRRPGGEEGDESGSCLPVFISKLLRMLSPSENNDAIRWGGDGSTVGCIRVFFCMPRIFCELDTMILQSSEERVF